MKVLFFPLAAAFLVATCGSRNANSAPAAQDGSASAPFVAPVTELAASLDAADPAEEAVAVLTWDKTVHDFGDVSTADGPLSCTFTLTNVGKEPIAIFEVVSSCGCTDVKWTREPVPAGGKATISATYKNEDGPTAFDKTLTVYVSGVKRPVVLRLRGVVHEKKKSLSELYGAQKLGAFGLKTRSYKTGTLKQGLSASETALVANLGKTPLSISFADVSAPLSLSVTPNPIPAGSTATLSYTVTAQKGVYGRNVYTATPVLNGKKAEKPLEITAWTQENFAAWSDAERREAALPVFETSTANLGIIEKGRVVEAVFPCANRGGSALQFFKADPESPALTVTALPGVPSGQKESVRFSLDTSLLPKGENVIMVSLTTNSPLRPLVNLFVAAELR